MSFFSCDNKYFRLLNKFTFFSSFYGVFVLLLQKQLLSTCVEIIKKLFLFLGLTAEDIDRKVSFDDSFVLRLKISLDDTFRSRSSANNMTNELLKKWNVVYQLSLRVSLKAIRSPVLIVKNKKNLVFVELL